MTAAVSLADLTRARVAEIAPTAVLVLAFGATEQHGPHLPFGTDFLVADAIARRAGDRAAEHAPVVLAPTLPFGSSHHHLEVGGALSLSPPVFEACARDLFGAAAATGFRRIFVLNGHGGNEQLLRTAARAAAGDSLIVGGGSYWSLAGAQLQRLVPGPAPVPGHAGRFETSLALALGAPTAPTPARESWAPAPTAPFWLEDASAWRRIDGYTDSPADGSADEGAACLEAIVAAVADAILEFERSTRETG